MQFKDMPETHSTGMITIENIEQIKTILTGNRENMMNADLGIMIRDGKVWMCVNGIALLRFKEKLERN